ncbi:hypothetical protein Tco_0384910 [Tanacetum coccineum]
MNSQHAPQNFSRVAKLRSTSTHTPFRLRLSTQKSAYEDLNPIVITIHELGAALLLSLRLITGHQPTDIRLFPDDIGICHSRPDLAQQFITNSRFASYSSPSGRIECDDANSY